MTSKEQDFVDSIKNKIKKFKIRSTIQKIFEKASGEVTTTQYNDGTFELVDTGIEKELCRLSPAYFIKRYCWINFPGIGIIPFKTYYFQDNILEDILDYNKLVFEKTRQCGLSTVMSLYCLWRANFKEAENIDVVSLKQLKAQAFVQKMKPTIERLPSFLSTPITVDNSQVLGWANKSQILSESQSNNAGRSDSLSLLILDEAAHYVSEKMVRGIVASAQPTLSRTGGQLVILSTPNGIAGPGAYYWEQVTNARTEQEKNSKLITIDWWEVPDTPGVPGATKGYNDILEDYIKKDYFRKPEVKLAARRFFDPIASEKFKENEWLKKQFDDLQEVLFKQEILHNFIVTGSSVFNEDILKRLELRVREPIEKNKLGNNSMEGLWIWKKPIPGHRYIIGIDVGTGTGNDWSTMQIFDVGEYEQAAEYKAMISTKIFGGFIKKVAKYYNEAFVAIECNSIGEAIFNEVYYHDTEPYQNVFKQKKTKNNVTRMTGWITDTKTRKLITNELIDYLVVDSMWETLKIYSHRLYLEATTWIWDGQKPVHASSAHDDALMSMALSLYLRNKAVESGESFIIDEKGKLLEHDSKDSSVEKIDDNDFDFLSSDSDGQEDLIKKRYKMTTEEYRWLIDK